MWREASKGGALADFRSVFRDAGPSRWRFAALALMTTLGVFWTIAGESWKGARPLPEITYITSWPEDRTEAETLAFIKENQRRKEIREAYEAAAREEERNLYKALGRASGMDVDSLEKKAAAERAADQAAEKAKVDAILERHAEPPVGKR